jgi:hypothetical protein
MDSKLLTDFIKAQHLIPSAPPKKATRTSNVVMNPGNRMEVEQGFEYIITKKPKAKKVMKYLQGMVDEIMADAD